MRNCCSRNRQIRSQNTQETDILENQPEITKIDVINDSILLCAKEDSLKRCVSVPKYRCFSFSNKMLLPYKIDNNNVVDFQKYLNGDVLFTLEKEGEYLIKDGKYHTVIKTEYRPILVDVSETPCFFIRTACLPIIRAFPHSPAICSGTLYLVSGEKVTKIPDKWIYLGHRITTIYYDGKLISCVDMGEWGGYVHGDDELKNVRNVKAAMIIGRKLFLLSGLAHLGVHVGKLMEYGRNFKTILESETSLFDQNRKEPHVSSFEAMTYDMRSHKMYIGMCDGILVLDRKFKIIKIINYDFNLHFTEYSANNPPTCMKIIDDKLYVDTYRGGCYVFDKNELSFEKRILFPKNAFKEAS